MTRPSKGADSCRQEIESQEVTAPVERLHLAADQPEEPHVAEDVKDAGVKERGRPELPDPAVLEDAFGRGLEPVPEESESARSAF